MVSSTFSFAILLPTKRTLPTGGVMVPMERFMTIITPKWMASMPTLFATGRKMGVKYK